MFIENSQAANLIAKLTNVQKIVMRTMLETQEDFDQLQPALITLGSVQEELNQTLEAEPVKQ
jgi:hypothetical protein